MLFCPDRRKQDTSELSSLCCSRVSAQITELSLPLTINLTRTPNLTVQPGVSAAAALPPLSLRRSCAAVGATVSASPRLLCLSSLCYMALCLRPFFCTRTLCLQPLIVARPPPCVTVPTDSTSAGGLVSRRMTPTLPSPAAVCGESGRSTQARMDSTAASDQPG